MAKYLIHAYPKRMWYVNEFLIPSMLQQGIAIEDIKVYNDVEGYGNLKACMKAFATCDEEGGTWHLQDDVLISKDFKQRTEWYDNGLVCGFSSLKFDGDILSMHGAVPRNKMWFSFPCIRIPNEYAKECARYAYRNIIGNPTYQVYWENGVNDDWVFRKYLEDCHPNCIALNLMPCLVNHIDYLIGGGSGRQQRQHPITAQYWADDDLVKDLERQLHERQEAK